MNSKALDTISTVQYGNIQLATVNSKASEVPVMAHEMSISDNVRNKIGIAYKTKKPILLYGLTGTGKSSIFKELAYKLQIPLLLESCTGYTTPEDLIGRMAVKDNSTYYEEGVISKAMRIGAIVVLEEVNMLQPDVSSKLFSLMDDSYQVSLPNGTVLKPHDNFRIVGTMNVNYAGTKPLNEAFDRRFTTQVEIDTLSYEDEVQLIYTRTGLEDKEIIEKLVTIAVQARIAKKENKLSFYVSTDNLIYTALYIKEGLPIQEAFEATIRDHAKDEVSKQVLTDFFNSTFKIASSDCDKGHMIIINSNIVDSLKSDLESIGNKYNELYSKSGDINKIEEKLKESNKQVLELQEKQVVLNKQIEAYKKIEEGFKVLNHKPLYVVGDVK